MTIDSLKVQKVVSRRLGQALLTWLGSWRKICSYCYVLITLELYIKNFQIDQQPLGIIQFTYVPGCLCRITVLRVVGTSLELRYIEFIVQTGWLDLKSTTDKAEIWKVIKILKLCMQCILIAVTCTKTTQWNSCSIESSAMSIQRKLYKRTRAHPYA